MSQTMTIAERVAREKGEEPPERRRPKDSRDFADDANEEVSEPPVGKKKKRGGRKKGKPKNQESSSHETIGRVLLVLREREEHDLADELTGEESKGKASSFDQRLREVANEIQEAKKENLCKADFARLIADMQHLAQELDGVSYTDARYEGNRLYMQERKELLYRRGERGRPPSLKQEESV